MEPTQEQKFSSSNIFLTKRADLLPIILFKKTHTQCNKPFRDQGYRTYFIGIVSFFTEEHQPKTITWFASCSQVKIVVFSVIEMH